MNDVTILSCAVTGNMTKLSQHPGLPCTPEQIADACIGAAKAGAAIVHVHVRKPDGTPSMELALYRETVERIRSSDVDVIINLTTGPGQRFVPSPENPKVPAAGTSLMGPEPRVEHVLALRPELCSLDLNTTSTPDSVMMNTPASVRRMAELVRDAGTVPELEVFDTGDIHLACELINEGTLPDPPLFQVVLGTKYAASATTATMQYMRSLMPINATWAAFGISRWEFPMLAQALLLGGHVRVGLEDNIYIEKNVLAPDNAALVVKAKRIVQDLGSRLATPAEAREILGLRKMSPR
jgi:uncharacterized protein (DUF849 family)